MYQSLLTSRCYPHRQILLHVACPVPCHDRAHTIQSSLIRGDPEHYGLEVLTPVLSEIYVKLRLPQNLFVPWHLWGPVDTKILGTQVTSIKTAHINAHSRPSTSADSQPRREDSKVFIFKNSCGGGPVQFKPCCSRVNCSHLFMFLFDLSRLENSRSQRPFCILCCLPVPGKPWEDSGRSSAEAHTQ